MSQKIYYLIVLVFTTSLLVANEKSTYGWDVPNSSLNIGGYLDMTYETKREEKFLFDDIAMLFSASHQRFNLLGEIELSHISLNKKSSNNQDIDLNIERLQLDYALSDEQMVQIGRFNSDVGYWNQAPIPILQETTTTPHMVGNFFPKATTGVLFRHNINEENSFSLTFQNNNDMAHQNNVIQVNQHQALAYYGTDDDLSWRFSLGEYREERHQKSRYLGIGSSYEGEDFSLQSELFAQNSDKDDEKPYSGYVQSTWHVKKKQDAVVRFESYKDEGLEVEEQIYLLGYTYRPTRNMALKGEYIYHTKLPLNRFVYSISVLF